METGRKRSNGGWEGRGGGFAAAVAADGDDGVVVMVVVRRLCARYDSSPLLKANEPSGRAESERSRRKCVVGCNVGAVFFMSAAA